MLTLHDTRGAVPVWITNEEGKKSQQLVWELIARELEDVEPGCVKKVMGL